MKDDILIYYMFGYIEDEIVKKLISNIIINDFNYDKYNFRNNS